MIVVELLFMMLLSGVVVYYAIKFAGKSDNDTAPPSTKQTLSRVQIRRRLRRKFRENANRN